MAKAVKKAEQLTQPQREEQAFALRRDVALQILSKFSGMPDVPDLRDDKIAAQVEEVGRLMNIVGSYKRRSLQYLQDELAKMK